MQRLVLLVLAIVLVSATSGRAEDGMWSDTADTAATATYLAASPIADMLAGDKPSGSDCWLCWDLEWYYADGGGYDWYVYYHNACNPPDYGPSEVCLRCQSTGDCENQWQHFWGNWEWEGPCEEPQFLCTLNREFIDDAVSMIEEGDPVVLAELILSSEGRISYDAKRHAVQIRGCKGNAVAGSYPISKSLEKDLKLALSNLR